MHKIKILIISALTITFLSVFTSDFIYAAESSSPRNSAEQEVYNRCESGGCGNAGGAIWVNNSSTNIYLNNINVATNGDFVEATIYSSIYTTSWGYNIGAHVYATDVKDGHSSGSLPFSVIGNNYIDRGNTPNPGRFSSAASGSKVRIDVRSVPADGKTYNRFISVYRCWSTNGPYYVDTTPGNCGSDNTPIQITRTNPNPPNNFSINAQSYLKATDNGNATSDSGWTQNNKSNPLIVYPGQFIQFKHDIRQNGGTKDTIRWSWVIRTSGSYQWGDRDAQNIQSQTMAGNPGQIILRKGNISGLPNLGAGVNGSYSYYKSENSSGLVGVSYEDIGRTICQRQEYNIAAVGAGGGTQTGNKGGSPDYVCAKVQARPWEVKPTTQIKSDINNKTYAAKDINVKVGETITWKHNATNTSNYTAPAYGGAGNPHGHGHIGYYLDYAVPAKPTVMGGTQTDKGNRYVNYDGKIGDMAAKRSVDYYSSDDKANISSRENIKGIYSQNNNDTVPTDYKIKAADTGKSFCQQAFIGLNKDKTLGGVRVAADWRCAYVAYDYVLKPCMESDKNPCGGFVPKEPGEPVPLIPGITGGEGNENIANTEWKITTWNINDTDEAVRQNDYKQISDKLNNTHYKNADTCASYGSWFDAKTKQCKLLGQGSGNNLTQLNKDIKAIISQFVVPEDAKIGSRYCFALSISPYEMKDDQSQDTQNNNKNWLHGVPLCVLVVKKPKLQVWGGDVFSGTGVQASTSNRGGRTYGSWGEYGVFGGGTSTIKGFTSGSALTPRTAVSGNWQKLTFANTKNGTAVANEFGKYGTNGISSGNKLIDAITARYNVTAAPVYPNKTQVGTSQVSKSPAKYNQTETISLGAGQSRVRYIEGDLTISGNITYAKTISGAANIPQHIYVVKGNINIAPNVTNIDSWLLASGTINTCKTGQIAADCKNPLVVNGPIVAKNIKLPRAAGSEKTAQGAGYGDLSQGYGAPAELVNMRAETFIWAYEQAKGNGSLKLLTKQTKEFSPRF